MSLWLVSQQGMGLVATHNKQQHESPAKGAGQDGLHAASLCFGRPCAGRYESGAKVKNLLLVGLLVSPLVLSQESIEEFVAPYPESPICRDETGDITLSYLILETGIPHKIEVVGTDSVRFSRSAIKTLKKYKFKVGSFSVDLKYSKTFSFNPGYTCGENS